MTHGRRRFLKHTASLGTLAAAAATGACTTPAQPAAPAGPPTRTLGKGLAKGLTLLTFRSNGQDRLGVKTERGVLDVAQAATLLGLFAPATMDDLLQNEDGPSLQAVIDASLKTDAAKAALRDEASLEYGPLVSRPEKIVCVGLNYRKHAAEIGAAVPQYPVLFNKFTPALNRHKGTVKLPTDLATQFDYEAELVIVMGRTASRVSEADALKYVAGYCVANDVSEREYQIERGGTWDKGKGCDTFGPVGPWLVTADEVGDPQNLDMWLDLNGRRMQTGNTRTMIFTCAQIVSYVSRFMTLMPGDIITTGTPPGVGMGMKPQRFLKPGDRMRIGIDGLGEQNQRVVRDR